MSDASARAGSPAPFSLTVTPGAPGGLALWRAAVAPMFAIAPLSAEAASAFAMETTGTFLPGMAVTTTTSSACTFERSRAVIARSGLETILVQVYLDGGYVLDAEGVRSEIRPGDVVALDLRRESTLRAGPYTNLALTIERGLIAPMIVEMDRLHGVILRAGAPRTALLTAHMRMLQAEVARIGVAEQAAVVQGTAALVAACLAPSLAAREAARSGEPVTVLHAIRRAIDGRLNDPAINPDALAKQFGLSRASLYRLFEPLGGVRAYIQQRRLMHAYHLLTSPSHADAQVGTIALRVGFGQSTAFSRAFRGLYGMTPSAVRATARSGSVSAGCVSGGREPGSGDTSFGMLNRWLLGLDANGR